MKSPCRSCCCRKGGEKAALHSVSLPPCRAGQHKAAKGDQRRSAKKRNERHKLIVMRAGCTGPYIVGCGTPQSETTCCYSMHCFLVPSPANYNVSKLCKPSSRRLNLSNLPHGPIETCQAQKQGGGQRIVKLGDGWSADHP